MGAGASGEHSDGMGSPGEMNRDARLEANSRALWTNLINHTLESPEQGIFGDEYQALTDTRREVGCTNCTFVQPISSVCVLCEAPLRPLPTPAAAFPPQQQSPPRQRSPSPQQANRRLSVRIVLVRRLDSSLTLKLQMEGGGDVAASLRLGVRYRATRPALSPDWLSSVFSPPDTALTLPDLRPDTLYEVQACAAGGRAGGFAGPPICGPVGAVARIRTGPGLPGAPGAPTAPEIAATSVLLHWAPPPPSSLPVDLYIVEMKQFGGKFAECYRGRERTFVKVSLAPRQVFIFRVCAVNIIGQGPWCRSTAYRTRDTPVVAAAAASSSSSSPSPSSSRPTAWETRVDGRGRVYYHHPGTSQSCWSLPQGASLDAESRFRRRRHALNQALGVRQATALSRLDPEEWAEGSDGGSGGGGGWLDFLRVEVDRARLLESSLRAFRHVSDDDWMRPLRVTFVGESGIGGGLVKDFFLEVSRALAAPELGLFCRVEADTDDAYRIDPRGRFAHEPGHLEATFAFVGRLLGKAVLDKQTVDVRFDGTLLRHLLGLPVRLADLKALDRHRHKGLVWMAEHAIAGVLDDETFTVPLTVFGEHKDVPLVPGGETVQVTDANKHEYIDAMVDYLTRECVAPQLEALLRGFRAIVPFPDCLPACVGGGGSGGGREGEGGEEEEEGWTAEDLARLLLGCDEIDVGELEAVAKYTGGYDETSQHVRWFWQAFKSFGPAEQQATLRFVTGLNKPPLDGFDPPFTITQLNHEDGLGALPRSHTCFNSLALPPYETYSKMREKLCFAVENASAAFMLT